jgi:DNA-binding transcriptional regulator YiaG
LAQELEVSADTIINWETRGMTPVGDNMKKLRAFSPEL